MYVMVHVLCMPVPGETDALAEYLLAQGLNVQKMSGEPLSRQVLSGQSAGAGRIFATLRGRRSSRMAGAGIFADMPTDRMMATREAVLESWRDVAREGSNIRATAYIPRKRYATHPAGGAQCLDRRAATRVIACLQDCLRIGLSIGRQLSRRFARSN
jgi:hypothetical protein